MKNFSAHLALFAAANMFVVGCVTPPTTDEGIVAFAETPTGLAPEAKQAVQQAFDTNAAAHAPTRIEVSADTYFEVVRSSAFTVKVTIWNDGSFIGTAEQVKTIRRVTVPGQIDQQVVEGVTLVMVATSN